jgi:hypothetical protein
MSEEDASRLLQDLFRSKDAPDLTDSEVEAFLSTPFRSSAGHR